MCLYQLTLYMHQEKGMGFLRTVSSFLYQYKKKSVFFFTHILTFYRVFEITKIQYLPESTEIEY